MPTLGNYQGRIEINMMSLNSIVLGIVLLLLGHKNIKKRWNFLLRIEPIELSRLALTHRQLQRFDGGRTDFFAIILNKFPIARLTDIMLVIC